MYFEAAAGMVVDSPTLPFLAEHCVAATNTNEEINDLPPQGLTSQEAARRLRQFGPNELAGSGRRNLLRVAIGVLAEPMFLLLAAAAAIYLVVGSLGEGLFLASFAALTIALVVLQQARSERALDALRARTSQRRFSLFIQ